MLLRFIAAFILIFLQAPWMNTDARATCDTSQVLAKLVGVQPNQVKWNVDLRKNCTISNQGVISACWANPGVEFYNQLLHQAKAIDEGKKLSIDYYFARLIRERAEQGYQNHYLSRREGLNIESLHDHIFKNGFVYEDQYQFPKINGKSIRESPELLDEMWEDLISAQAFGDSPKQFSKKIDYFLGDLSEIKTHLPDEALREKLRPHAYFGDELEGAALPKLEKEIIQSLERKMPIQFGMKEYGKRMQSSYHSSHIYGGKKNPLFDAKGGRHSMNIVGYRLGKDGNVDLYLVQNSWGEKYGTDGFATIHAKYLYEHLEALIVAPALK